MNRRAFLAASLLALAAGRPARATTPVAAPDSAIRAFAIVGAAPTDAESLVTRVDRLAAGSPPFPSSLDALIELGHFEYLGAMRGEYYVGEVEPVAAPDGLALATRFADFVSTAGIAAFRQEHTLGMLENDRFRWTIQATGGTRGARVDLVGAVALLVANRAAAATPVPRDDSLWDLLPALGDLPVPARIVAEEAPARA